jgi:arsenate reductase-like glutaredoxin family protein
MPVTMYHNPRCNTSRRTLALLREKSVAGIKALLLSKRQSVAVDLPRFRRHLG